MNTLGNEFKATDKMQASAIHQTANMQKAVPHKNVDQFEHLINRYVKRPMRSTRERVGNFHEKYEEGIYEIHSSQLDNITAKKLQTMPVLTEYMDKSMKYSPDTISKSIDKFFMTLKGNEAMFIQFKEQLLAAAIGIATVASHA